MTEQGTWPKALVYRGPCVGSSRPDYRWWQELPDDTTADGARLCGYPVVEVIPARLSREQVNEVARVLVVWDREVVAVAHALGLHVEGERDAGAKARARKPAWEAVAPALNGAVLIAAERERQMAEEGWTAEHDDSHSDGELADFAACLAATEPVYVMRDQADQLRRYSKGVTFTTPWPYELFNDPNGAHERPWGFSSVNRIDRLVKAGALIAAEIDRLQRAPAQQEGERDG